MWISAEKIETREFHWERLQGRSQNLRLKNLSDPYYRFDDIVFIAYTAVHCVLDVVKIKNIGNNAFQIHFPQSYRFNSHRVDVSIAKYGLEREFFVESQA